MTARKLVKLTKLRKLVTELRASGSMGRGLARDHQDVLERAYKRFVLRRFDVLSIGGSWGGYRWPRLAWSTRKRKGHGRILVDTRHMRLMLSASIKVVRRTKSSMTFAFVNSSPHPRAKISVGQLLKIHNVTRTILAQPDERAVELMGQDLRTIRVL